MSFGANKGGGDNPRNGAKNRRKTSFLDVSEQVRIFFFSTDFFFADFFFKKLPDPSYVSHSPLKKVNSDLPSMAARQRAMAARQRVKELSHSSCTNYFFFS